MLSVSRRCAFISGNLSGIVRLRQLQTNNTRHPSDKRIARPASSVRALALNRFFFSSYPYLGAAFVYSIRGILYRR